jgi:hypothetical protein
MLLHWLVFDSFSSVVVVLESDLVGYFSLTPGTTRRPRRPILLKWLVLTPQSGVIMW